MANNRLFDLIERISGAERLKEGHEILRRTVADHGLKHVAYTAINLPSAQRERPLIAITYAPEWARHYLQEGYVNIDPVVKAGFGGILPIDWSTIDRSDPIIIRFFGEAQEFSIGPNGLTIPIRGRHGEFALFSVSTEDDKLREWEKIKNILMPDLMMMAYYFHDWALKTEGITRDDFLNCLSLREKDCLKWRALGKSDWDISHVLGIGERTVKFHLENARHKLGAANTTHAVAKAISHGLIIIP